MVPGVLSSSHQPSPLPPPPPPPHTQMYPHARRLGMAFLILILLTSEIRHAASARVITIVNSCKTTIWPAATPGDSFNGGGFPLQPGQTAVFTAPAGWVGRIWARTGCDFDRSGNGSCQTGACGAALRCTASGQPPTSLAEFTLASPDFYDVSLVDGFNLPLVIRPINGQGNCSAAGCDGDLLLSCPGELQVRERGMVVGCGSACNVFDTDAYCCRGVFENPVTCQPTAYSRKFKDACPAAYSYAYDDPTSIFTCSGADYVVTFCSNRRQNVCTYHDNMLICSGTGKSNQFPRRWLAAMLFSSLGWWFAV